MGVEADRNKAFAAPTLRPAGNPRWSERTVRLLEATHTLCVEGLIDPLRRCLDEFAKELFARSERAPNVPEQQDCYASYQRTVLGRSDFLHRFRQCLATAFTTMDGAPAAAETGPDAADWQSLALVDPGEQEVTMRLAQVGSRGESRHASVLFELGYRLAVLIGAAPLEGKALPLSPERLAGICHQAAAPLELPLKHQILLLDHVERWMVQALGPVYAVINARLEGEGILPRLRGLAMTRRSPAAAASTPSAPAGADGAEAPVDPAMDGALAAVEADAPSPLDLLESLRGLLLRQRAARGDLPGVAPGPAASNEELQSALVTLQRHLADVTDQASRELRSATRLREELLTELNQNIPQDAPRVRLSDEQGDTVELVARLFQQLGVQLNNTASGNHLLGGLQLPVLRMAVADRTFFERREHPARRLLDTVAQVANDWLDNSDDEGNRQLAVKLEQLVERANRETPSAGLYTTLLADIEHHLALLTRKAQVAERRHIEAAKGRERLDQARARASELMAERFAADPPRGLLRALLDRAWTDVLALTLLRHGEDSAAFRDQLDITDQLLGRLPVADRRKLQAEVEAGLQQIGMHTEEAQQVAQRLIGADEPPSDGELPSATDLAVRLRRHHRLGEQAGEPATPAALPESHAPAPAAATAAPTSGMSPPGAARPTPAPAAATAIPDWTRGATVPGTAASVPRHEVRRAPEPSPREKRIEEHLRSVPFGSWFEFVDRASGQRSRRKLAWYSPVSGRCLMVSRRGQPSAEMTLGQLAHQIARGRAIEVPAARESLVDRTWRSLVGNLRDALRQSAPSLPESRSP